MAVNPSDVQLVYPEFHAPDIYQRVGGFHTQEPVESDVDSILLPGCIVGSDSSDSYRDQYRKIFLKNFSSSNIYQVKVYGFNVNSNAIVKFALEMGNGQYPKIDGSEVVRTYLIEPRTFGDYVWTECHSDDAMDIGNGGILLSGEAQGIWLRQRHLKNASEIASDVFRIGVQYSEIA